MVYRFTKDQVTGQVVGDWRCYRSQSCLSRCGNETDPAAVVVVVVVMEDRDDDDEVGNVNEDVKTTEDVSEPRRGPEKEEADTSHSDCRRH